MKLKRLIAAAGLATVLAIGVGTGITINREAERVDAVSTNTTFTIKADDVIAKNNLTVTSATDRDFYFANDTEYLTNDPNLTISGSVGTNPDLGEPRTWKGGFRFYKGNTFTINLKDTTKVIQSVKFASEASSTTAVGFDRAKNVYNAQTQTLKSIVFNVASGAKTQKPGDFTVTYGEPVKGGVLTVAPTAANMYVGETFIPASVSANGFAGTVTYNWVIKDTNVVNFDANSTATLAKPTFKALAAGKTTATLTVTDGAETKTATINFDVQAAQAFTTVKEAKALTKGQLNVTGEVFATGYRSYYICDPDGTGIQLFDLDKRGYSFRIGDIISVVDGQRSAYKGSQQLQKAKVVSVVADSGSPVVNATPKAITVDDMVAANSNDYATISNVVYTRYVKDTGSYGDNKMYFKAKNSQNVDVEFYLNGISDKNPMVNTYVINSVFTIKGLLTQKDTVSFFEWEGTHLEIATTASGLTGEGQKWGATLLVQFKNECGQGGTNEYKLTKGTWDKQKTYFDKLPQSDKDLFKAAAANANGTAEERVAALYDYCVNKYDFALANNYIARAVNTTAAGNNMVNNSTMIIAIVAISTIAVSAIALLVIFKRKRLAR